MILLNQLRLLCLVVIVCIGLAVSAAIYAFYLHVKPIESLNDMNRSAIVSNGIECAEIGKNIFRLHNGSAVDAMIATLFCEGIAVFQGMGLGGGFVATLYHKEVNLVETLTALERAPLASTEDMFAHGKTPAILSVGIPGELKGYWEMHQKYGHVPWKLLIEPSIELCRRGHIVTSYLAKILQKFQKIIKEEPALYDIFVDPATNEVWQVNDRIKRPQLAKTLEIIAVEGVDSIYSANGTIAQLLVDDITALGGIITIDDLVQYTVEWNKPVSTKLRNNLTLYSTPLPSSGNVLAMILNVMDYYEADDTSLFFHRLVETYKYAYVGRSRLGDVDIDPNFLNQFTNRTFAEQIGDSFRIKTFSDQNHYGSLFDDGKDAGTAHVSVIAQNGDTVTVTSTINNLLGAKLRSRKTGILLNDIMHVFARPGNNSNQANLIQPGKRPLSSMCPTIIMDSDNNVVLAIGSAGGSKITTSTAYCIIRHLWKNESLIDSIGAKRIHQELHPMQLDYEAGIDANILNGLRRRAHVIKTTNIQDQFSAVTAISKAHNILEAVADPRRNGSVAIF